jgi:hypothetical protein
MPEMFSTMMATFFANFMPWVILTWSIAYYIFISNINSTYGDEFSKYVEVQKQDAYDKVDELQTDLSDTDVE